MKKKNIVLVFLLCLGILLTGCSSENKNITKNSENDTTVKTRKLEPVIFTDLINSDINFECNVLHGEFFLFNIYSTFPLEEDKLTMEINSQAEYDFTYSLIDDSENNVMPMPLYYAYNGEKYDEIKAAENDEVLKYNEFADSFPEIYEYSSCINFKCVDESIRTDLDDWDFTQVTFKYEDKSYTYDIGSVKFSYDVKSNRGEDHALTVNDVGVDHFDFHYSPDGVFRLYNLNYYGVPEKNIIIKSIEVANSMDGCAVQEARIKVDSDDENSTEYTLKEDNNIIIPKGATVGFDITLKSEKIKNNISYNISPLLQVNYLVDGKEDHTFWECTAYMNSINNPYEMYAYLFDKVDIFEEYANDMNYANMEE